MGVSGGFGKRLCGETNGAIDVFLAYVGHVGAVDGFVCVHFEGCE